MRNLTRRDFLRFSGAGLGTASLLALTGCRSSSSSSSSTSSSESESSSTETESSTAESAVTEDGYVEVSGIKISTDYLEDLGTAEDASDCTIPRSDYVQYPIEVEQNEKLTVWCVYTSTDMASSANETYWGKLWQEKTGVEVEFIHPTSGSNSEEFATMIASSDLPDIISWSWMGSYTGGPTAAIEDGLIITLNDYVKQDGLAADFWQYLQDNPSLNKQVQTDDGDYYCFPLVRANTYLQNTSGIMYRADILEAAGYTGELETLDDWEEALAALKDYGVQYPLTFTDSGSMLGFLSSVYEVRAGLYVDIESGEIKYSYQEEGYKNMMKKLVEWVNAGYLDPEVLTNSSSIVQSYILNDQAAVTFGAGGSFMGNMISSVNSNPDTYNPDFALETTQFPVVNSGDDVYYSSGQYAYASGNNGNTAITTACENVDLAVAFLNFCYSEAGHYTINFGEEDLSYTWEDGVPTYTDEVMNNPDGYSIATAMAYYCLASTRGPIVQDPNYIFQYYASDSQKRALESWSDRQKSQASVVPPITLTSEESSRYSVLYSDVNTYVSEYLAKFFTQEVDIDETWDSYVAQLKTLGSDEMVEIYQSALDRYNAR